MSILLYVEDADTTFAKAIAAGGKADQPVEDKFYGDRTGSIVDPFGHQWYISTHVRDVPMEEMLKAAAELAKG